ncbi:MAG: serine/threonine-protein kinase [Labilithrix sp.]
MPPDSARESPLASGSKLDGYELLWPIGEGGMATVWVARLLRKHGFEKLVAIKTILPKFAEDEAFQTMFLDEARIASRIDHPNVAHIHDLGEHEDILYLVMEYVDGDALTRLRKIVNKRGKTFPVGIALKVMADVLAGLHAAHELKGVDGKPLGVVHRDVSPQNILITTDGSSKLIDFGVAKAAGRLTAETHTGYVKGKVQYMAPEQALGKNVDRRADIWAVGAVIYHLVANRPPFEADNQLALLNLLQRGRPPAPLDPNVPTSVSDIIKKALTHNAMQRFQTAAEMRAAIDKTGLIATQEEVADFVREHLGDMAERRRSAIASAIQSLETGAPPPVMQMPPMPVSSTPMMEPGGSTQRIDPKQLPNFGVYARQPTPTGPHRPPPPSDPRIGPPTPHSFPTAPNTNPGIGTLPNTPRRTEPAMVAVALPVPPPPPPSITATPPPFLGAPTMPTEPLPPLDASYDNAFNDNTNTNGGSLGLASISSSISTRRPRNVPLIAGGIGGGLALIGVLLLAVSVGRGGGKKLDSEFSPLPSTGTASAPATTAPPPPPTDELPAAPAPAPAPEPAPEPVTPAKDPAAKPVAPTPAPVAHPVTSGGVGQPFRPAPAGSGRKKPRVDDGF